MNFDLHTIQMSGSHGIDGLLSRNPELLHAKQAKSRVRVASVGQLAGFTRISTDTLIHKSDRDLWALKKEADGSFYVERLFDDNGEPIKG